MNLSTLKRNPGLTLNEKLDKATKDKHINFQNLLNDENLQNIQQKHFYSNEELNSFHQTFPLNETFNIKGQTSNEESSTLTTPTKTTLVTLSSSPSPVPPKEPVPTELRRIEQLINLTVTKTTKNLQERSLLQTPLNAREDFSCYLPSTEVDETETEVSQPGTIQNKQNLKETPNFIPLTESPDVEPLSLETLNQCKKSNFFEKRSWTPKCLQTEGIKEFRSKRKDFN